MNRMKKTIEIVVDSKGAATVQTRGFQGASCREASRFIEESLGQKTSERFAPEFYQVQSVVEEQQRV